ncbi:hypothetical protein ACGFSG_23475 [Streptomyces sp. NPDC048512]|uniref:hypothetical protein n=1 Tax=unclassified Streptomyces TaxID=2593676 RepID=UPI00371CC12C
MKRSMIALLGAAAMTVALGGYAVGATLHDSGSERSARCEQAARDFTARAGQVRKLLDLEHRGGGDLRQHTFLTARTKVITGMVVQNPACFDAGTRATASFLRQHPAEDEREAATCDFVGVAVKDCSVSED